jgi:hypothetical protein
MFRVCGWDYAKQEWSCADCAYSVEGCRNLFLSVWRQMGGSEDHPQVRAIRKSNSILGLKRAAMAEANGRAVDRMVDGEIERRQIERAEAKA